jgi:hypothetical protein
MEEGGIPGAGRRGETEEEALDRNLDELLQELRVATTGVQVLFAFLLVVPFQQGWTQVTEFEKTVYFATLLATAGASICLIGPTARHRVRFRELDKRWIVETSHRLALAGLAFLTLAMSGAILLVSHVVYGTATTAIATAVVFSTIVTIWFIVPLMRELRERAD